MILAELKWVSEKPVTIQPLDGNMAADECFLFPFSGNSALP
jgi:hypothetical protein